MKKFFNIYNKVEEVVLISSLVFTVILIFIQVIMRYVFNNSLSWSEELARYIFIWQIWMGASVGIRMNEQIRVEIILKKLSIRNGKILDIIAKVILFSFCIFLIYNGFELAMKVASRNALSSALRIPLHYVYLSLPVSAAITSLRLVNQIIDGWKSAFLIEGRET
ncbi:MAG: TRAP transporter small permease [Bacillota bacterium]|nr:TRAP transporter small permease [Bacillota bacterium]